MLIDVKRFLLSSALGASMLQHAARCQQQLCMSERPRPAPHHHDDDDDGGGEMNKKSFAKFLRPSLTAVAVTKVIACDMHANGEHTFCSPPENRPLGRLSTGSADFFAFSRCTTVLPGALLKLRNTRYTVILGTRQVEACTMNHFSQTKLCVYSRFSFFKLAWSFVNSGNGKRGIKTRIKF
jgi:hypothetical protein